MPDVHIIPHTGQQVRLGYRRRPFDARALAYAWSLFTPNLGAVDLSQPRLFWGSGPDPRLQILSQKQMGSCTCFGALDAATALCRRWGIDAVELMHDYAYEQVRKVEHDFPQDAGADPADVLDLAKAGLPPQSAQPGGYIDDPAATFDQYAALATLVYVGSFHPILPTDSPNMETLVWSAIDQGYVVNLATMWTQAMFSPKQGKLPTNQTPAMSEGGHDIYCWGIVPNWYLCDNSWDVTWTPDAPASGFPGMRPGSFAIPWKYGHPRSLIEVAQVMLPPASAPPVDTRWADFEAWWKPDTDYLDAAQDPAFLATMGTAATAWAKYLAGKVSVKPTVPPPPGRAA